MAGTAVTVAAQAVMGSQGRLKIVTRVAPASGPVCLVGHETKKTKQATISLFAEGPTSRCKAVAACTNETSGKKIRRD